ncbi:TP901 family phage tail tape measure protein [Microbacterium phyllosphaerae]|uniref:TP901 family phage tail tape measure protein n=1 Tax=Microbacterium phyllosphaerae TaxID=124798 RepID=A0ABS4WRU6_9MICO|nr:phage tail tape measure protein [Microbacterium phyllosphaerae]MBP2378943.1 TP901 family phage tail tape measure protein [Microbacterium phyllosphaerae]
MAERVTAVILEADISQFARAMNQAADSTKQVSDEGKKLAETHQAMTLLGTGMLAAGAAIAAGVGVAVMKYAEFDAAMSNVAATGDDARANMDALREAALDAGASTVFSATESANAIEELAKAGLSAKDILGGGLKGALDLAAAGGLEVADAAGIAATALKVFNLRGEDMSHVADLLAAGAGKAMGDVSDLSAALAQGGQIAAQTGLSIEETTATLAAFASQGLLGSDAGTSFKSMLQRLTPQSKEAADKMKELGISAYDASGNFVGMEKFAGNLQTALKNLTPEQRNAALAVIFGSDAVRAASVLYSEGADGVRKWTEAVNDQGYAAETAAQRLDNLIGDWEAFTGALDTAFITMGEGLDGPLRGLVQGLTGLVDGFNDLPDAGKQGVLWIGLVTAGVGLLGGATLIAVPKLAAFKIALQTLGVSGASALSGISRFASFLGGPWGIALVLATGVVTELATAQARAQERAKAYADTLAEGTQKVTKATRELIAENITAKEGAFLWLEGNSAADAAKDLGISLDTVRKAIEGNADALDEVNSKTQAAIDGYDFWNQESIKLNSSAVYLRDNIEKETGALDQAAQAAREKAEANRESTSATDDATAATEDFEAATQAAVGELEDMVQALLNVAGGAKDMTQSHDDALASINALVEAAAVEGASLTGTNDASIRFRDSIREVEQAHLDSAVAILENGGTLADAQAEWQRGRDKIIEMGGALGESSEAAVAWADQNLGSAAQVTQAMGNVSASINNVPKNPTINLTLTGTSAVYTELMRVQAALRSVTGNQSLHVSTGLGGQGGLVAGNENGGLYSYKAFANGGMSSGIYRGGAEIHKFAEKTLPWEAYISPKSDQKQQNYGTWLEVGNRLGFNNSGSGSRAAAGPTYNFNGDIYGQDPGEIAREVNTLVRRASTISGVRDSVGD